MTHHTPEEKAQGRQNFVDVSRRDFLKAGTAAVAVPAVGLGAFYFGYGKVHGAPVRVGVIGTGDEGSVLIGAVNPEYVEVKAIADIRPYSVWRAFHGDHYSDAANAARPGLMAKYGWKTETEARRHVEVFGDYRELIANAKDLGLEGVIIALPLHLHAPASIAAMQAGLHVLTEKLMGHSVNECKEMAMAAEQTHRHLATGHQRHYNILYQEAMDTIQRDILGDIHYIRAQWHRGNLPGSDSWQQPMPTELKPHDTQAKKLESELRSWRGRLESGSTTGAEIERWATLVAQKEAQLADALLASGGKTDRGDVFKSAEEYGYKHEKLEHGNGQYYDRPAAEELIRWRLWKRTGGGLMVELGSHQLDAASIFISAMHGGQKQLPLTVSVFANRPIFPLDRQVNDHIACIFEFPAPGYNADSEIDRKKKIGVQYSTINGNGYGGYGEIVYGTKGTLILEREQDVQLFRDDSASKMSAKSGGGPTLDTQASAPAQAAVDSGPQMAVSRGYAEEIEHWAWCIRNNPLVQDKNLQPRCNPKVALADAVIALTTNIAASEGRRVTFDPAWFDPQSPATPDGRKPDLARYNT